MASTKSKGGITEVLLILLGFVIASLIVSIKRYADLVNEKYACS
uniref:Uncharacterized protein n=1 Tax=viral metagenome TaxID=1070528 RepID=A0A6C0HZA2_9ZZZZ